MKMATIQWVDMAAFIGSMAALITASGAVWVGVRSVNTIKTTAKDVSEVKHTAREIDRAVNGKRPDDQTISEQVDDLHKEIPPKPLPVEANGVALLPLVRAMTDTLKQVSNDINAIKDQKGRR